MKASCISQILLHNNQPQKSHRTINIYFIHLSVGKLRLSELSLARLSDSASACGFGYNRFLATKLGSGPFLIHLF